MVGFWRHGGKDYICLDTHLALPDLGARVSKGTAQVNYLMARYLRNSVSDNTAAALAIIVKDRYDDQDGAWQHVRDRFFSDGHQAVRAQISHLLAEAATFAGPYKTSPKLTLTAPAAGASSTTGTISNIGVQAASGAFVANQVDGSGFPVVVTVAGGGTFPDGTTTKSLRSAATEQSLGLVNVPLNAKITVTVKPDATLAADKFVKRAAGPGEQNMALAATYAPVAGATSATAAPIGRKSITLGSQVRNAYLTVGQSARDFVNVGGNWATGQNAGTQVTISSTLYGPLADQPAQTTDVPAGTPVFETFQATRTFGRASEYTSAGLHVVSTWAHADFASKTIAEAGYYVWVEQAWLNEDPDHTKVTAAFGRPWEMHYAARPKIVSQVSQTTEYGVTTMSDSVSVSGFRLISGADWTSTYAAMNSGTDAAGFRPTELTLALTGKVLGPSAPVNGSCTGVDWANAPTALVISGLGETTSAYATSADNDGTQTWYGVGSITPRVGQCYTYTYSLAADSSSWDVADNTAQHTDVISTAARNVFQVSLAPGDPTETAVSYSLASEVSEHLIVADATSGETSGTGVAASTSTDTVKIMGLPSGTTIPITATLYGPIRIVKGGDQNTPFADDGGTQPLVDPPAESWSFATANPQLAPVVKTFNAQVTGDGTGDQAVQFTSPALTAEGWYVWVEASSGNPGAGLAAAQTSFGRPSESVAVVRPSVGTRTSAQRVVGTATITDTVSVGGVDLTAAVAKLLGKAATFTLTGEVYGPIAPDGTCKSVDWAKAGSVPVAAQAVRADGTIAGFGAYTVGDDGLATKCYTYGETLTAHLDGAVVWTVRHRPGLETETTLATLPRLTTRTSAPVVGVGASITDSVTVTGLADQAEAREGVGTVSVTLHGPLQPPAGKDCSALTSKEWLAALRSGDLKSVSGGEFRVTGNGTYTTAPVAVPAPGCWTWYEKLTVGEPATPRYVTDTIQSGEFGVAKETTLAIAPAVSTLAHGQLTRSGTRLTDDVMVTGLVGTAGVVTGKLLGPVPRNASGTCDGVDWSKAAIAGTIPQLSVTGDGTYTTAAITVAAKGCYTFVETLTPQPSTVPAVTTVPGLASETIYVSVRDTPPPASIQTGLGDPTAVNWPLVGGGAAAGLAGVVLLVVLIARRRSG